MQKHLEEQVSETAAVIVEWRGTIAKIETEFNIATLARDNAKRAREKHALGAAMQDASATAEIKHARAAQTAAEETISDLGIALPEAEQQLAAAEKAAASARHALAMHHGEKLMRQRVEAAARMDAAFAESAAAYSEFERLGRELQSFPDLNIALSGNMSHWETVTGYRRIAAALPLFFLKLFPQSFSNEAPRTPIAKSEADFWQLPPEQPEAKAA
jgi:hypothetical protein